MSSALFLFTIGPVKSFIDHSRKTRDLYAGSYLLSFLITEAIEKISRDVKDIEIIFPARNRHTNIPNRLVAIVKGYEKRDQEQLGQALAQHVRQQFMNICMRVFRKTGVSPNQWAVHQIERFLEIYWVFQEFDQYEQSYTQILKGMSSIKRLRIFTQTNEPYGRKCDIYPEYNAVVIKKKLDGKLPSYIVPEHVVDISQNPVCKYAIKPGEGLSAISFVKRMLYVLNEDLEGLADYQLHVTSVAYMLLKNRLGTEYETKLARLKDEASEAIFDLQNGQALSIDEYSQESIDVARELHNEIKNRHRISPYYALVKFDGDGIGSLYKKYPDIDKHKQLSMDISRFASNVRTIITEYGGISIYAGGEDFLGFLPLDTLFPALIKLHREFPRQVRAPLGHSKTLTFSAGVVIAHLMEPLRTILARTGELESFAKELEDKDAFAIELRKRSGDKITIRSKFGLEGERLQVLHHAIIALKNKQYAKAFIQNLVRTLTRLDEMQDERLPLIVRVLIQQAFQRSNPTMTHDERDKHIENFFKLYQLFGADIPQFIAVLQLAVFLSREVDTCSMPLMQ
ncbi:type III-B CRISPR-associated protein Cas10/Cmr2 [Paenibacillus faecalis]|uniref:type III-B CRISPR-associated protein Cas10/Cmr2 n=1 Tax=Paenibacillus faecalis TaxID=2079532 RepID=UPI000D1078A5|nr:type III-B CRISPR-associated protein Cas10/Cmr2 [Paenibacillus faecalis]